MSTTKGRSWAQLRVKLGLSNVILVTSMRTIPIYDA